MRKTQRVRDPLHNLIEFDESEFEQVLWRVIQTAPFQRLRRIRQLGFSEFVYPGATHTRFTHSIGVYHTARQLMKLIKSYMDTAQHSDTQERAALAAALVHDVGHGMFSHAFEDVGRQLNLNMATHEGVSTHLIRNSQIANEFKALGIGFAEDVASVIEREPANLYDAVVSSQFDADRLDYMQRDRLMTGVKNSGIDFIWLINNLEIGKVPTGSDDHQSSTIETFVLGPKARHSAEAYVLSLFQLYPTVYFHKTTRGAEKLFTALMARALRLIMDGSFVKTGLPNNHPIVTFGRNPGEIESALLLDDGVFWGALPLLREAPDPQIRHIAHCLLDRNLPRCIDVKEKIKSSLGGDLVRKCEQEQSDFDRAVHRVEVEVKGEIKESLGVNEGACPRVYFDHAWRNPYRARDISKGTLDQISIRTESDQIIDMAEASPVVAGLQPFELFRAYVDRDDDEASETIEKAIDDAVKRERAT